MRQSTTGVVVLVVAITAHSAWGQSLPDSVKRVLELHRIIEQRGEVVGPLIWPGFRPDTIPTLYVIAQQEKVLVQWRHPWPAGFNEAAERRDVGIAGKGMVSLPGGKFISFMSVDSSMTPGLVLGTSIHEAFHSFERSLMKEGQTFGSWENAMLVGTYPVFDVENEAAFALEGRKLRQALEAPTVQQTRRAAREFLALREARQRVLDSEFTEFEKQAEMNEGLAQYSLIRGLTEIGRLERGPWPAAARQEAATESALLDSLLGLSQRSVRRRFYATGSAIALVLDRLAGQTWKAQLLEQNLNLQETLALVTGFDSAGESGVRVDSRGLAAMQTEARRSVDRLRANRVRQADSIANGPGTRLTVDAQGLARGALQWCGFDPQNTLQTGDGRTLHMRFLNVCAGSQVKGSFQLPVVQHDSSGTLSVGLGQETPSLTQDGKALDLGDGETMEVTNLKLMAPSAELEARRARISRRGTALAIQLMEDR
jgi:hypothetical protein